MKLPIYDHKFKLVVALSCSTMCPIVVKVVIASEVGGGASAAVLLVWVQMTQQWGEERGRRIYKETLLMAQKYAENNGILGRMRFSVVPVLCRIVFFFSV